MTPKDELIKALNREIAAKERKLEEAKKAAILVEAISADLASMRRTRDILRGRSSNGRPLEVSLTETILAADQTQRRLMPGSISSMVTEILREAATPLHVDELLKRIHARGRNASKPTIVGAIARDTKTGRFKRVAKSTYALVSKDTPRQR